MADDPKITPCREDRGSNKRRRPPKRLRQVGIRRIAGRTIIRWSGILGSYGMGGPGFFGLYLGSIESWPDEWLVLTVWGASDWLLLDGQWVGATPGQWAIQRPLYSNFSGYERWDDVSKVLNGAMIVDIAIHDGASALRIRQGNEIHVLEIPDDHTRLPRYAGNGQPRAWPADESQWDAWVISQTGDLWC